MTTESVLSDQEARARLAAIVSSSDDAIVSKDLNGIIQSWNAGAERIFGYRAAEAIGKPITILIPEPLLGEEKEIITKIRAGERVSHYETVRRRKDGSMVDISLTVSAVKDESGRVIGASKIARDISEQKAARRALAELTQTLERRIHERTSDLRAAVADLESFNYAVSHDLRTPLRAIIGFVELVVADPKLSETQRQRLKMVLDSSREMTRITEGLLRLSRARRAQVHREQVDLSNIARGILARLQSQNHHRAVEILVDDGLTANADRAMVEVVLENLLGNAWKFTERKASARIHVGQSAEDGKSQFFVTDNGVGFTPAQATELFRPFRRLRPREFDGIGIGLATVQQVINAHGGEVRADGRPDGATIVFHFGDRGLPTDAAAAAPTAQT